MANVTQCVSCGYELAPDDCSGACPRCSSPTMPLLSAYASEVSDQPGRTVHKATQSESLPEIIYADQLTEAVSDAQPAASDSPSLPPSLTGYMIIGRPMSGGMGTVWPAKQLGTKRTV